MSIIDKALEANRNRAKNYDPKLGKQDVPEATWKPHERHWSLSKQ